MRLGWGRGGRSLWGRGEGGFGEDGGVVVSLGCRRRVGLWAWCGEFVWDGVTCVVLSR